MLLLQYYLLNAYKIENTSGMKTADTQFVRNILYTKIKKNFCIFLISVPDKKEKILVTSNTFSLKIYK